jgi:hypothetical protein
MLTTFHVPRLESASVAAGACCPVPAEALILPELEYIDGVHEAGADWRTARVWVRHADHVRVEDLAAVLEELGYPATNWERDTDNTNRNSQPTSGVTSVD